MEIQGYTAYGLNSFTGAFSSTLGQGASLNTASDTDNDVTSAFAQDIVLRLENFAVTESDDDGSTSNTDENAAGTLEVLETEEQGTDAQDLANSLARAVDYIRDNFGDKAASATIGLVYQNIGDGDITEKNLGDGLIGAVKLIDSNFGFAAGDQVMSFFNNDVNEAMNEYFDNGLMEEFYASVSTSSGGSGSSTLPQAITTAIGRIAEETDDETASTLMEIITSSLEENGKNMEGMKTALEEAQAYLDESYDSETAAGIGSILSQGLAKTLPDAPLVQAMNQQGSLIDLTV